MNIIIYGWKPGFAKVSFSKFLRSNLELSIGEAKAITDKILAGSTVEIEYKGGLPEVFLEELSKFDLVYKKENIYESKGQ